MSEKTETNPMTAIPEPLEEIADYYSKRWYHLGFRFAINYIYVSMVKSGDPRVDAQAFRAYLDDLLNLGIEDDFFERYPFTDLIRYPIGQCPGDTPGTCIQCPDGAIAPFQS